MTERVVVYVPAYNVSVFLDECIAAIRAQTYPVADIVVIDDGSTDDSASIAERCGARVIRHPRNLGLSAARNTAFREIDAPFIASLDADCVAEPDWLARLMPHMENPSMAGAGGTLIERNRDGVANAWRAAHMEQSLGPEPVHCPHMLFGNNNVFRRRAILEVGSYPVDERYRTNNEDYYISRRLREQGWRLQYDPRARVHHGRTDDVASINRTYWRWFFLHRPRPSSPKGLLKKTVMNLRYAATFARRDVEAKRWGLVPFDLAVFPAYQTYHDIAHLLDARAAARPSGGSR